jgi:CIC family chloride channel protein
VDAPGTQGHPAAVFPTWRPHGQRGSSAPAALLERLALLVPEGPLELRIVGRVLLHAALVGLAAGVLGTAFLLALDHGQRLLLEGLGGLELLRARGEGVAPYAARTLLPWALVLLPVLGGLASGLLTSWLAPETAGGGGDATIEAYHRGGNVRARVVPVKFLAAFATLSTGGSGGREGPTMHIGAAIGAAVGRLLPTSPRERRVLLVAGIAAGISAVFRTPLGAALLAAEMLHRDDFEGEALVPAILASVVAYSVAIAALGETTLFGHGRPFPFTPRHLPLYAALALLVSLAAAAFVRLLRAAQAASAALPGPVWLRPAAGGLVTGALGAAMAVGLSGTLGPGAAGFGVLGGGYGVAQAAMDSAAAWMPGGWDLVLLLLGLAAAKAVASAATIGSGGAAGDFAPSLVIGALCGAAFAHAARALLHDPSIDPAAFALVGMGTFYGGVAHVPLAALVLVAELAGSYDLLVPMMLTVGIAYVALRRWTLYPAQPATRAAAPLHDLELPGATVGALAVPAALPDVREDASLAELARAAAGSAQRVLLVRAADGRARGLVDVTLLAHVPEADLGWTRAGDAMIPFAALAETAGLREAIEALRRTGLPQLPVVRGDLVVGWVGEREIARAVLGAPAATPAPEAT